MNRGKLAEQGTTNQHRNGICRSATKNFQFQWFDAKRFWFDHFNWITLHCIALYYILFYSIILYYIELHCIAFYCCAFLCTALYCSRPDQFSPVHSISVRSSPIQSSPVHSTRGQYIDNHSDTDNDNDSDSDSQSNRTDSELNWNEEDRALPRSAQHSIEKHRIQRISHRHEHLKTGRISCDPVDAERYFN
jgi:hypothetical protein